METDSSPAASPRLSLPSLLSALGGGLILGARPQRGEPERPLIILVGIALLGLASRRPIVDALRSAGARRHDADLHFSFLVERPVEQVFAFCADFENFPKFIGGLREVRDTGNGRSHWCANTPSGGQLEWSATTTKFVTNSVISWKSVPGASVHSVGLLRFSPEGRSTCVRVALSYRVFDSSLVDALAALVAPKRARTLELDIRRMDTHLAAIEATEQPQSEVAVTG